MTNIHNYPETSYNEAFIIERADPFMGKGPDGTYYFTGSVPEYDRIVLRSSKTVKGLRDAEEVTVWTKHEHGPMSWHIWAPELHYLRGEWYIYFGASEAEDVWKLRPYVLHCKGQDPMKDEWEELGVMQAAQDDEFSFQAFSLDGTVFENKGELYYIWAEKVGVGKQISNLYIARMETPWKLATVQVLLTTPDYDWERVGFWVDEGPFVWNHEGTLFMTFSGSATGACYCMGLMSISEDADLLDPHAWKKERYPVLITDAEKGIYGPGHNSVVKAEDGVTDLCVYHARPYEEIIGNSLYDPNRHARIMKITYDEKGMPQFVYPENPNEIV